MTLPMIGEHDEKQADVSHRLVKVEWEDSAQPVPVWQWVETYEMPDIIRCISVGYLIADTPEAVAVAPNIGDVGRDRIQASGIIRIPRRSILRIIDL